MGLENCSVAGPSKILRSEAVHRAPVPDWNATVAEVVKVMKEQLKEAEAEMLKHNAAAAVVEATHGTTPPSDTTQSVQPLLHCVEPAQEAYAQQSAALQHEAANAASSAAACKGFGAGAGYSPGGAGCNDGRGNGFNDAGSYGGSAGIGSSAAGSYVPSLGPSKPPSYTPLPEFGFGQVGVCPGAALGVKTYPTQAASGQVLWGHPAMGYP